MSFAQDVKKELCALPFGKNSAALAECYGILLFANIFRGDEIRIITQSGEFAARIVELFFRSFGITVEPKSAGEGSRFVFSIIDQMQLYSVFEALGIDPDTSGTKLSSALLKGQENRGAFLRGAFLSGGSLADPNVRYHLEFCTPFLGFSGAMSLFFEQLKLTPRVTTRAGKYVIYFKSSESIADIITMAGAHRAALEIIQAKVVKQVRNGVNRYVNCETANISRTVSAAQVQTQAIEKLQSSGKLDVLPPALRETALIRLENPEASLSALGEMLSPPVNRATLNYRLKKLLELASAEEGKDEA